MPRHLPKFALHFVVNNRQLAHFKKNWSLGREVHFEFLPGLIKLVNETRGSPMNNLKGIDTALRVDTPS